MASKTAPKGRSKGTGSIEKRGKHFILRKMEGGQRVTTLLRNENGQPCTTRPQAEEAAQRINKATLELDSRESMIHKLAEIKELKNVITITTADVWEMFQKSPNRKTASEKQTEMYKLEWMKFAKWLKGKEVTYASDITPIKAGEYMAQFGEHVSPRTFNGCLAVLKMIINEVGANAGIIGNPLSGIKNRALETVSRREFSAEQVKTIFDGFTKGFFYNTTVEKLGANRQRIREEVTLEYKPLFKDEMEVLLKICCFTGADGQSACLMQWSGIDLESNQINYIREKTRRKTGGRIITLPIHPELKQALLKAQEWKQENNPYVLPNVADRYKRNHSGVQKDVMKIIRIALGIETTDHEESAGTRAKAANLYSLHSFRHTFVSFCANAGVPLAVVAAIVGHGSPAMTKHYSHISAEAKGKALAAIPTFELEAHQDEKQTKETEIRNQLKALAESLSIKDIQKILNKYGTKEA